MSLFRKLIVFFAFIIPSVVILIGIGAVQNRLTQNIKEHHLRFTGQIKNAPPIVAFTTVALGSFRGIVADMLWLRAQRLQQQGNYFEMVQLADWITKLQPRFAGASAYLAWNMAYNISVTCSSFEDRWRWVNEGIRLLRDEALVYNPENASLYKELGWIFQHKLGNTLDDANLFYKNKFAIGIQEVIGVKPDWKKLAAAPTTNEDFLNSLSKEAKEAFNAALKASNLDNLTALFAQFKTENKLPEKFTATLDAPELARSFDNFFRAKWLRDKYKLDAKEILAINNEYGTLDWRIPESQAIYWATLGLKRTPSHKDLSCDRMIAQALAQSFKYGRILYLDRENFSSLICIPNLNIADAVLKTYDENYEENDNLESFKAAKIYFLKEAVIILYNYGNISKAKDFYKKLKRDAPGKYPALLERFVMGYWARDVANTTVKQATELITGLLYSSINFTVLGEDSAAITNEKIARYLYQAYQRKHQEISHRVGLPPYKTIKDSVIEACKRTFPPEMRAILEQRIEEQRIKAKSSMNFDSNVFLR